MKGVSLRRKVILMTLVLIKMYLPRLLSLLKSPWISGKNTQAIMKLLSDMVAKTVNQRISAAFQSSGMTLPLPRPGVATPAKKIGISKNSGILIAKNRKISDKSTDDIEFSQSESVFQFATATESEWQVASRKSRKRDRKKSKELKEKGQRNSLPPLSLPGLGREGRGTSPERNKDSDRNKDTGGKDSISFKPINTKSGIPCDDKRRPPRTVAVMINANSNDKNNEALQKIRNLVILDLDIKKTSTRYTQFGAVLIKVFSPN
ncbi:hypothetical protein P5V15_014670 [Pogonomyrmex californicus]